MRISPKKSLIRHRLSGLILTSVVCLALTWLYGVRGAIATAAPAQFDLNSPDAVPIPVVSEGGIVGFELFQKGIYWWSNGSTSGSACAGSEFETFWTLKFMGALGASTKTVEDKRCVFAPESVVRDSQYFYYVDEAHHLVRKAVNAKASDPTTQLTKAGTISHSVIAIDSLGRLYWSIRVNGALRIMRMKADNSELPTIFTTLNGVTGDVTQMVAYRFRPSVVLEEVDGIAFTVDYKLWRYTSEFTTGPQLLGSSISDFSLRLSDKGPPLGGQIETFYAANDNGLARITAFGSATTLYSGNVGYVTVDDVNIYISVVTQLPCPPGEFCSQTVAMYRRALSAPVNSAWDLIVAEGGGSNLRSDGQFVYFMPLDGIPPNPTGIAKVPTNAPPVQIDVEALDLEVTQAIQDMKESFALVAGHPTVVRGYAHLATSSNGASYQINATLTGKLNGQPLPGGPLYPLKSITLDATTNKQALRANPTRTFLFVLPESWVKDALPIVLDQLQLELTVNPGGALPENVGADPGANNKVSATALVGVAAHPCLMMKRVRADGMPVLAANPPGLAQSVARARSLMPLSDFQIFSFEAILSKGGFDYEMDKNNTDPNDDNDDGAFKDLDDFEALSSLFPTCSSVHWIGMLHPDSPVGFGGIARINGHVLLAKINSNAGGTLAHELGHNFGRHHIKCIDAGGTWPPGQDNFDFTPYDPCYLYFTNLPLEDTYYGFDFFNLNNIQAKLPQNYADIMSYAGNTWASYVYWQKLMTTIPNFGANALIMAADAQTPTVAPLVASELLYVGGDINFTADTAAFNTVYRLPDGIAPPSKVAQSLQAQAVAASQPIATNAASAHDTGNAIIRQLSANDVVLSETVALTQEFSIHSGGQHRYSFSQYMAFNPQTTKVQLVHDNQVLAERTASAHSPTLTLATPVLDEVAGTITLRWSAGDSDGDALHAMILYSNDDGAHWLPLDKNVNGIEAIFNTQGLAGGATARLRLIVDDGFNTAVATSAPFAISKHPPTPLIDGVVEGQRLPYTSTVTLYGIAFDADEGSLDGNHLTWSLSGPSSQVYSGTQVILTGLAPGVYNMSLSAIDSDGMTGIVTKHFEILPLPVPDSNAPKLDGDCSDAIYGNAVVVPLDGQGAQASMLHSGNALYVCFSGLTLGPGAATNIAGLRVDGNNSRDTVAQSDDRGFFINEENIPFQTVGNGSDMPVTLSPALGYAAVATTSNTIWSAELSIAEPLIGGWGHSASILFQYNTATPADNGHTWPAGRYNQPSTWAAALFGAAPVLENRAPVANAGGDQSYALGAPTIIALDSSASYDADLDALTPSWSQTAGPGVTLTNPTTSTIRFIANPVNEPTMLRFQLTVSDGKAASSPDEVAITLLPSKPNMGGAQTKSVYLPLVAR